ncbi:MAG TPA: hypothetical protein VEF06_10160 [Bryobacteraceae bacterium]|nr:hypothetical protein [Bryobacteraceae bacterium]
MYRVLTFSLIAATLAAQTFRPPRTPDGHPDFQGIWNSATATPMERPQEFAGKPFFTEAEAHAWETRTADRNSEGVRLGPAAGVGNYNNAFWEFGSRVDPTMRTSMVTDPPDGRVPPLTPSAQRAQAERQAIARRTPTGPEDLGLGSRCLAFPTGQVPMTPFNYNSNYSIFQTPDYIAISAEMIHDTRIIPLRPRPHLPSTVRLWFGDSVGHWEGDTLVIDTTNFTDKTPFYGSDANLHVVERLRWYDAKTLLYQFEIEDATAFTRPWKGELTMAAAPGPIYEYACHEGNYALPDILRGLLRENP